MTESEIPEGSPQLRIDNDVAYITFERPERKNALRVSDRHALVAHLQAADLDDDVRVVVLRGSGGTFCSGGDISEFAGYDDVYGALDYGERVAQAVFRQLQSMSKPTIACVEGAAAGAGMFLALGCDIVIAADDAYFVASHVNIGLPPDWGAMWRVPRLVGIARAKAILLTGRKFPALRAESWGLIAEAVPQAELEACVESYCANFRSIPAGALRLARRAIDTAFDVGSEAFLVHEATVIAATMVTKEHKARVDKFLSGSQSKPKAR